MFKDNTNITLCPVCYGVNTRLCIDELVEDTHGYKVKWFCKNCSKSEQKWTTKGTARKSLDPKLLRKAVVDPMGTMTKTMIPMGVCLTCDCEAYGRAFAGKLGVPMDRNTLAVPAFNTWGSLAGKMIVSRYACYMPRGVKWKAAGLLSDEYAPKRLIVCENPVVALMLRYASALMFTKPVSVMIPVPGRTPVLDVLQDPIMVRALVQTEDMLHELLDILPDRAILTMRDVLTPAHAGRLIRTAFSGGMTVGEWRKRR
jgi:hypothetical protein